MRPPTIPASAGAFILLVGVLLVYWGGTGIGLFTPKATK